MAVSCLLVTLALKFVHSIVTLDHRLIKSKIGTLSDEDMHSLKKACKLLFKNLI